MLPGARTLRRDEFPIALVMLWLRAGLISVLIAEAEDHVSLCHKHPTPNLSSLVLPSEALLSPSPHPSSPGPPDERFIVEVIDGTIWGSGGLSRSLLSPAPPRPVVVRPAPPSDARSFAFLIASAGSLWPGEKVPPDCPADLKEAVGKRRGAGRVSGPPITTRLTLFPYPSLPSSLSWVFFCVGSRAVARRWVGAPTTAVPTSGEPRLRRARQGEEDAPSRHTRPTHKPRVADHTTETQEIRATPSL
ncbi:hypothetical protein O3P69_003067 [Scylla paramamosain]|uniref:Uncharacterized protein n=1 Tax=Scylla paramamosain TaxID=85552 RepID=A0AAW0UJT3_SCYPA